MTFFRKQNSIIIGGIVLILAVTLFASVNQYIRIDSVYPINDIRAEINDMRYEIEQGSYPPSDYAYLVFDLSGKVLYADDAWKISTGDTVVVEEMLQQDKSFLRAYEGYLKTSFVLRGKDNACNGFAVYLIPEKVINKQKYTEDLLRCFLPVGGGILLSCIVLIIYSSFINRRILSPLRQIGISAQAIIKGDYNIEVQRVYDEELKKNEVGELTYSFELMRDELKAKQLSEQSLRKAQQELMSCISHDLRTPISTIKAYTEGIRDGVIVEGMNQQDYTRIILEKTNVLEKMITDLLEYSNTQLNKMEINRTEIYFRDYALEIARELRIYVTQYGVKFFCEIMDENLIVKIDPKRITEVLYNLVENSLKYMDKENGQMTLSARIADGVASLHINDNGMGICAEDIPYVFDRFYRAEKSRSSDIPGSGLGLSICKYIVDQHGGEIYCKSQKNNGSEFWFTLS